MANTYSAGTAFLTVVPSFRGIEDAFKAQVREMAKAADKDIAAGMAKGLRDAGRQARGTGAKAGQDWAGAYAAEAKRTLDRALQSLPEPQPGVNMRKWDKALAQVRSEMRDLSQQRIGIDIDRATYDKSIDDFRRKLEALRSTATGQNKEIGFFNADQAAKSLAEFQKFADDVVRRSGVAGDQAGSAFNQRMARVIGDARTAIPPIKITADSTDAEQRLKDVGDRLATLQSQKIGVDIDAAGAYTELRSILNELQRLDRTNVRVDIRTNAHEAAAGIAQFVTQAENAGQATQRIGNGANFSLSRLEYLIALGASLGTSIVPAALSAAAAVGLIGTSAIAAVAGIGVFALGISGVSEAVKALNTYSNEQAKSAASVDQANQRVASSTNQVRMAQMALANTRRNVSEAAEDAARRVADAERAVGDARRQAAQDLQDAARAVRDARRSAAEAEEEIGEARRQAARDIAEANRQVRDAQRDVTEAETAAREVRLSLNEAIAEAVRNMAELDTALKRNQLEQDKAVTAQMEALQELNELKANPRATEIELRRAKESYDEQTVRLLELKNKQKEMAEEKAAYDKKGVEGDKAVIAARKQIAAADQRLADAREKLAREQDQRRETEIRSQDRISDAQDRAARAQEQVGRALLAQRETEIRASRRIADAERSVSDARRQQARQRADGEYQIAQATNTLTQAQEAQQEAWKKTGTAGGAALDKLNEKMDALSPAGQRFAKFLFGLKDEMQGLRAAAAEPLLPQLETAITMLLQYLPSVERFVGKVAQTMGELAIRAVEALGSPVWQRFFGYVDETAVPSLEQLFEIGKNVTEGFLNLFLALTPFNAQVGTGLVELSRDFAEWAERLDRTQGFQDFMAYVQENGPRVVHFLGELGHLFIDLVTALMPIGEIALRSLTLVIDGINSLPTGALTFFVGTLGVLAAGFLLLGGIMRAARLRRELTDIFGPRMSSMVQTYAMETGRATEQTGRFGRATATVAGLAAATGDRVRGMADSIGQVGGRMREATTGTGPLARGLDAVRGAAFNAALAVNGPGGMAGAVQNAQQRVVGLAAAGEVAAQHGLGRFRTAMLDVAAAANGPGGMAAGVQAAGGQLGGMARSAGTAATSLRTKLMGGMSSLVGFIGGPWAIALIGATAAIGYFTAKSAEQKARVDGLKASLSTLVTEYQRLAKDGRAAGAEADAAFQAIVRQNPEMQEAVIQLDKLGVGFDEMMRAATSGDPASVLAAIDAEIRRLDEEMRKPGNFFQVFDNEDRSERIEELLAMRTAFDENAKALGRATQAENLLTAASARNVAMANIVRNNTGATTTQLNAMATAWDTNQIQINQLNGVLANFGDNAAAAGRRADDLTAAIKRQYGAAITANEANETWSSTLLDLTDSVKTNGTSLSINTREGLANRDALQRAALATRDMFIEEVRMGGELPKVTAKHADRINKLRDEATRLKLTKADTDKLIKTYGEIDPSITTKYTTQNFDKVFEQAKQLQFAQVMLELGITDEKEARARWNRQNAILTGNYPTGSGGVSKKAIGGAISGPGSTTSDDVLIWASNDEHMLTAAEVKAAGGHDAVYAWRRKLMADRQIPHPEDLAKHATGGAIGRPAPRASFKQLAAEPPRYELRGYQGGGKIYAPFIVELGGTKLPTMAQAMAAAEDRPNTGGSLGDASGGNGYAWQMSVLRKQFPGLAMHSGPRPGSRTANGSLSWHGRVANNGRVGRAVDVPPRQAVFNYIHDTYGKNTKELIWGGDPGRNIQRGQHHRYNDALLRQHGPYKGKAGPSPHIHWAFDQGGYLMPGMSNVVNQTGLPEPVLTNNQWKTIETFVSQGMAGSGRQVTNMFEFRDTTLDASWVRAQQQRDDAINRVDRPF